MTAAQGDNERHLIPRWRSLATTVAAGELRFPRTGDTPPLDSGLSQLEHDWDENRSLAYAADFVGAALLAGEPERANAAAELLGQVGDSRRRLADRVFAAAGVSTEALMSYAGGDGTELRPRELLRLDLRNPIAWLELGRLQLGLGHVDAARRSIHVALGLAPNSRYVLRSACTFFVETGEPDRALHLIRGAIGSGNDPWVVGAEIAIAETAGRRTPWVRQGRSIVERGSHDPRDVSELAAELATLEAFAGAPKRAKKLFVVAFKDPTENSVAQGVFVAGRDPLSVGSELPDVRSLHGAAEARSRQAVLESQFDESARQADDWRRDQPFSLEAATFASFVKASGTLDWEGAAEAAQAGLIVHPGNQLLLNNQAYSLIELGRLSEARQVLATLDRMTLDDETLIVADATYGLLAYRSGDAGLGATLYADSIARARRLRLPDYEALACVMHARELGPGPESNQLLARAHKLGNQRDAVLQAWLSRVRSQIS